MLLSASEVTFSYTDRPVLRDVALALAPGEVVTLIGPNGSGKSTLLRVLLGHLNARGASIEWENRNLRRWPRRGLARRIAYLPQAPTHDVDHRVRDVLRLGRSPYWSAFGIEAPRDADAVSGVARQLNLTDLLDRRMDELSGGQRQRVFIGRCLVQEPVAMLLDEPSTFLDLRYQVELLTLLRQLAREHSIGVLMASHDLNLAAAYADRMVLMSAGRIAASGAPAEVMREDLIAQVYGVAMERIERKNGAPVLLPRDDQEGE